MEGGVERHPFPDCVPPRPGSGQGSGDMETRCHWLQPWEELRTTPKFQSGPCASGIYATGPHRSSTGLAVLKTLHHHPPGAYLKRITYGTYSVGVPHIVQCIPARSHLAVLADTVPLNKHWEDGVSVGGLGFTQEEKADKNLVHKAKNTTKQRTSKAECLLILPGFWA